MELAKLVIKAAKKGDAAVLRTLLDQDSSLIHAVDTDGSTPLHCAAWKGHEEAVSLLLERGAPVTVENENDHWGGTPLHAAAHANNAGVVKLLLAGGADPAFRSRNGRTPLEETGIHNATAAAKLLRQALGE